MSPTLSLLAIAAAQRDPGAVALRFEGRSTSYAELDETANRVAGALIELGVVPGDRVGLWLEKGIAAVTLMQGVLRAGAAYVPIDRLSPWRRTARIVHDAGLKVLAVDAEGSAEMVRQKEATAQLIVDPPPAEAEHVCAAPPLPHLWWSRLRDFPAVLPDVATAGNEDALAYVLYTSGTTGKPKGVCLSHRNALAFVDWAVAEVGIRADDHLGNHAPFHFDLSVFDIYAAFHTGARLCIPSAAEAFSPRRLVRFLIEEKISVWYSVPSVLGLMMDHGGLLNHRFDVLRALLFAGEIFPPAALKCLRRHLQGVDMWNFYGPTETNVCTSWRVPGDLTGYTRPIPIGRASCGNEVWAVNESGHRLGPGETGELWVHGPTVMLGYWGEEGQGDRPLRSGDLVRQDEHGDYVFVGRKDHQVKVGGHRIELEEIEATLCEHSAIREAVVVVREARKSELLAFVVSTEEKTPDLLELKAHCAERLPRYMVIDRLRHLRELPRTPNGKIDRQRLQDRPS